MSLGWPRGSLRRRGVGGPDVHVVHANGAPAARSRAGQESRRHDMDAMVRRKIEMAARVAEFSRANPADDPSYEMLVAKLESLLAQGAVLAERERVGRLASRSAARRRLALMRALEVKLMPH